MAWSKNGTTTLSSAGDDIDITSLTASDFNVFLGHILRTGNVNPDITFDNTTGNDYATRYSYNGGIDNTSEVSQSEHDISSGGMGQNFFFINYSSNIASEEKLCIQFDVRTSENGAGSAPNRKESVWKKDTSTDTGQYTRIDINNSNTGDFDTGSNLTALNGDTTEELVLPTNLQSGSRFEATDTRKIYYGALPSVTFEDDFSSYTTQGSADSAYPSENTSYTRVNISNDTWEFNQPYSTSIHAYGSHDFGSGYISNNKWVLRFVVNYSTWNEGSSHHIVLSSGDHTVSSNTSGYQNIGVRFEDQMIPDRIYLVGTSNGTDRSAVGSGFNPSGGITTGTPYYVEIIRNVNSYTLNVRTGSHSGTLLGTDTGTVSGITSLRYLKISNIDWDVTTSTGDLVGAIDNIQLWNGVSSTTDFTWTEEA